MRLRFSMAFHSHPSYELPSLGLCSRRDLRIPAKWLKILVLMRSEQRSLRVVLPNLSACSGLPITPFAYGESGLTCVPFKHVLQ